VIVTTHQPGDAENKRPCSRIIDDHRSRPPATALFGVRAADGFAQPNYRITGGKIERA